MLQRAWLVALVRFNGLTEDIQPHQSSVLRRFLSLISLAPQDPPVLLDSNGIGAMLLGLI